MFFLAIIVPRLLFPRLDGGEPITFMIDDDDDDDDDDEEEEEEDGGKDLDLTFGLLVDC